MRRVLLLVLLFGLFGISAPGSSSTDDPEVWSFTLQPYLWAPAIEGNLKFSAPNGSTGEPEIDIVLIVTAMGWPAKGSGRSQLILSAWNGTTMTNSYRN